MQQLHGVIVIVLAVMGGELQCDANGQKEQICQFAHLPICKFAKRSKFAQRSRFKSASFTCRLRLLLRSRSVYTVYCIIGYKDYRTVYMGYSQHSLHRLKYTQSS